MMNNESSENPEKQNNGQEKKEQQEKIDNAATDRLNTKISDLTKDEKNHATNGDKKSGGKRLPTDEEIDKMVEKGNIERDNLEKIAEKNPAVAEKLKNLQKAEAEYRDSCEGTVTGSKEGRNRAIIEGFANVNEDPALSPYLHQTEDMSGPDRKIYDSQDARKADNKQKAQNEKKAQIELNEELKEMQKHKKK